MLIHRLINRVSEKPKDGQGSGGGSENQNTDESVGTSGSDAGSGQPGGQSTEGESNQGGTESGTEGGTEGGEGSSVQEGTEETVVKIGDEELPPAEEAKPWVKELRRKFKEQSQELARLRGGASAAPVAQGLPPAPGSKPKINDPEIDYDAEKLVVALDKWHEASNKYNDAKRRQSDQQAQEQRAWEQTVAAYQEAGAKLGFSDYEDCEAAATAALSETQAAIIVQGCESAEKAALIMYSLGRNMKLVEDLAKIQDPVKFAFAVADMQRKLSVFKRKPNTKPESSLPASGVSAAAALAGDDKKVAELREEASKTGDMTKLLNYQRQRRLQQQARK